MVKLGMLTPSSNTILEPVTYKILEDTQEVSAHFSRFVVREISLRDTANQQFKDEPMLAAARLLADADVDLIIWNGTSASWLGIDEDHQLCQTIEEETKIPAVSASIAIIEAIEALKMKRVGLVTPYTADVSEKISENYHSLGYECVAERMCGITVNKEFANVPETEIRVMLEETMTAENVEGLVVVCTNFHAASLVAEMEAKYHRPIIDSVSATVWYSLKKLGISTSLMATKWGKLFEI